MRIIKHYYAHDDVNLPFLFMDNDECIHIFINRATQVREEFLLSHDKYLRQGKWAQYQNYRNYRKWIMNKYDPSWIGVVLKNGSIKGVYDLMDLPVLMGDGGEYIAKINSTTSQVW